MNPIIYACSSREFKRAFVRILRCQFAKSRRRLPGENSFATEAPSATASATDLRQVGRKKALYRRKFKKFWNRGKSYLDSDQDISMEECNSLMNRRKEDNGRLDCPRTRIPTRIPDIVIEELTAEPPIDVEKPRKRVPTSDGRDSIMWL
ncbi:unnamed protein product [Dimorphilus gyrociliatus]|uniref:Uncharacterized protein n=1 Tax=Dimorphilus gyrociliatus TaxID=2664684 RepID=A0A7I8W0S5_9ANNE|nr:unnamed protein product [Dimorphilus gyrociliatus]